VSLETCPDIVAVPATSRVRVINSLKLGIERVVCILIESVGMQASRGCSFGTRIPYRMNMSALGEGKSTFSVAVDHYLRLTASRHA